MQSALERLRTLVRRFTRGVVHGEERLQAWLHGHGIAPDLARAYTPAYTPAYIWLVRVTMVALLVFALRWGASVVIAVILVALHSHFRGFSRAYSAPEIHRTRLGYRLCERAGHRAGPRSLE
jgi:hypothetical protein